MKKLYSVRIELDIEEPVVAESDKEAEDIMMSRIDEAIRYLDDSEYKFTASLVEKMPKECAGAFAFSSDRNTDYKCDDVFAAQKVAEKEAELDKIRKANEEKQLKFDL